MPNILFSNSNDLFEKWMKKTANDIIKEMKEYDGAYNTPTEVENMKSLFEMNISNIESFDKVLV